MFDDDDPLLGRVRDLALAFPDAAEKISHGHPAFYTTKVFAYYGGSRKVDGEWEQHGRALLILADPDDRDALLDSDRCFVPAYLARPAGSASTWTTTPTGRRSRSCSTRAIGRPPASAASSGWTPADLTGLVGGGTRDIPGSPVSTAGSGRWRT